MKGRSIFLFLLLTLCSSKVFTLRADEGMWMTESMDKKWSAIRGAIVSYDFMGTGSLVSADGLVVTNHHVVFSDVSEMSTLGNNFLRDGFWAYDIKDELPIPGRSVQIHIKTIDVTEEVMGLIADGTVKESTMMGRRLGAILEKKYSESTGKTAILSSMWKGSRYYIDLYDEYKDIRLVAAPPEIIGAFGGDEDNWEWPQQKGDFSFVRIYAAPDGTPAEYSENNVPLKTPLHLKVSTKGVREGDKTFVMGYPGKTNRYAGSAQVNFQTEISLPLQVEIRGMQMEILRKWMNSDEAIRAKYADHFFSLSNAQELYLGQVECNKRFDVVSEKKAIEAQLGAWINASAERKAKWGTLLSDLDKFYTATAEVERQMGYFRECMARACKLSPLSTRTNSLKRGVDATRIASLQRSGRKDYESIDLRVEREIFRYVLEQFLENVSNELMGPYQRELKAQFKGDYDAMCTYLWDDSWMTNPETVQKYCYDAEYVAENLETMCEDKLCRFFNDCKTQNFNDARDKVAEGKTATDLNNEYVRALYQMRLDKGIKQYPDANSTLRITNGKVGGFSPRDAVYCSWNSTVAGLLEKHRPDNHDFNLPESWRNELSKANKGMTVNFITDNDITGGNSGSPVMNSKGEVVGLCFDGNKESLASDVSFTPDYNRCVCVDIRFVLWTLEHFAHFDRILGEIDMK